MSEIEPKEKKRFYWLKLQSDFFNSDDVKIIRAQVNGSEYLIFWLQLLLKCITQVEPGVLRYKDNIPFTDKILATVTDTKEAIVVEAMALFRKMGMIKVAGNGDIWIEGVKQLVGSETQWNRWKKEGRYNPKWLNSCEENEEITTPDDAGQFPADAGEKPIELELEKELDTYTAQSHKPEPPFFNLETRMWNSITDEQVKLWEIAYPACDIENELAKMASWLLANPTRRKTKRGYCRFINSWLDRCQNKGGTR